MAPNSSLSRNFPKSKAPRLSPQRPLVFSTADPASHQTTSRDPSTARITLPKSPKTTKSSTRKTKKHKRPSHPIGGIREKTTQSLPPRPAYRTIPRFSDSPGRFPILPLAPPVQVRDTLTRRKSQRWKLEIGDLKTLEIQIVLRAAKAEWGERWKNRWVYPSAGGILGAKRALPRILMAAKSTHTLRMPGSSRVEDTGVEAAVGNKTEKSQFFQTFNLSKSPRQPGSLARRDFFLRCSAPGMWSWWSDWCMALLASTSGRSRRPTFPLYKAGPPVLL